MAFPKFFYNNDGSFLLYCAPPMTPEEFVYEAVGRFIGTQVDAVVCHMYGFGDAVPLWPSEVPGAKGIEREKVGFVSEWRQQQIMKRLWAEGIDPWKLALEAAHEAGMQYWVGKRFNDLHGPRYEWRSEFRAQHPEYELGDECGSGLHGPGSVYGERCTGLNYAIPEVRAHRLAIVLEACERYDVDGFEWDFQREPGHSVPNLPENGSILTAYVREARTKLNGIGDRRARPLGFGVRCPVTLEKCHAIGLELETWIAEGLVDYISPAPHWDSATDSPFEEFVDIAKDSECRVLGCTSEQVGPGQHPLPPAGALRAGAMNAWQQGVDGVYVFNFHHQTTYNVDDSDVLSQLGDLETLAFKDKLYVIAGTFDALKRVPHETSIFAGWEHQLPVTLQEGSGTTVRFRVADDLETAARRGILDAVTLELIVVSLTSEDEFEFKLNGRALPETALVALNRHYRVGPGPNAYHGNYALRYDVRVGDWVRQGWNQVEAMLKKRNSGIETDFVFHDLSLEINYRILPMRG